MRSLNLNFDKALSTTLLFVVLSITNLCSAQSLSRVGFYNVQNLYDTINDPAVNDAEFVDNKRYDYKLKIKELSSAISALNADILGVCEVENYGVLEDLTSHIRTNYQKQYSIVHYDSRDSRGIDVALIYDKKRFILLSSEPIENRYSSRDILRAEFCSTTSEKRFVIYVAHLPSKRGGKNAKINREKINKFIDSLAINDNNKNVIVCGDFNDNPTQREILYNTSIEPFKKGMGSYAYRDDWSMIDQILISPELKRSLVEQQKVFIIPQIVTQKGKYRGYPRRNRPSDHLPVYIDIEL